MRKCTAKVGHKKKKSADPLLDSRRASSLPNWIAAYHYRIREPCYWLSRFGVNQSHIAASLPYKNHARSRLGLGNCCCRKCPQGEVGSPCRVLYGKPMPKRHIREHTPFESHFDGSTAIHIRKIAIQELAQTLPMRQLSEEF